MKKATSKPVRVKYAGIQPLAQVTNDLYYKSSRDRVMDLAKAINEDILEKPVRLGKLDTLKYRK